MKAFSNIFIFLLNYDYNKIPNNEYKVLCLTNLIQ